MASGRSQSSRLASIQTSLGVDVVVLDRFTVSSRLSEPFLVLADVSADGPIDFRPALYQPVAIAADGGPGLSRSFHGLLFAVERHEDSEDTAHYQLIIRPWLAALAEQSNVRIFQNVTVKDILQSVFAAAGFHDFEMGALTGVYPVREYCVQFRETDFAFVSRLMEDEGIYYYFRHESARHVMVLCDGPGAHHAPHQLAQVEYLNSASEKSTRGVNVWRWSERFGTAPARLDFGEHHFLTPKVDNLQSKAASGDGVRAGSALYDHPSGAAPYAEAAVIKAGSLPDQTQRFAEIRLNALRAETLKYFGETSAFAVSCGDKLSLVNHPQLSLNNDYLIIAATHVYSAASYQSGGQGDFHLEVHVEAVPFTVPWRPTHRTPKPLAGGPQTARVVGPLQNPGPTDDTIHVDEHGRVKVQFYWDRLGKLDQNSSCWVRVSQGWADGGYGAIVLPRIGQDVIVDFLDGDPDRPIITGRVYNAGRMPPYALPANKTISTLKSRTVGAPGTYEEAEEPPSSDTPGFNELRFEDAGAKEEVFLHAQRNMNTWVRLDEQKKNGRDAAQRVGRNKSVSIKKNLSTTLDEGDERRTLTKGSRTTTVKSDEKLTVQSGSLTTTIDEGNHSTTVSQGNLSISISAGKATVTAAQSIELTCGSSSIKMTPASIEMNAMTIKINAQMALSAQGGLTSELKAGTMLTVNGAVVMIN
jgi:type VI secretion system secreted protein VgrG